MIDFALLGAAELAGIVLAASLVTIALYLLKPRPIRVVVPMLALWESVLMPRPSAALLSRLRSVGSLLIALLVVVLLALARGGPIWSARAGKHTLVLIDAGAHMQARDVLPSRLRSAIDQARVLIDTRAPGDQLLIAQLDQSVTPLSAMTSDPRVLHAALTALVSEPTTTDLSAGLRFARDALHGRARSEVVLISDGVAELDPHLLPAMKATGIGLRQLVIGARSENVRIRALSARGYLLDPSQTEIMVEVESESDRSLSAILTLRSDGRVLDSDRLELAPHARRVHFYDHVGGVAENLDATLALEGGAADDLPGDNHASITLPARRHRRVLAVSEANRYLEAALLLDETLSVDRIDPADYTGAAGYDVVVFDAFSPDALPTVAAIYLAPPPGRGGSPFEAPRVVARPRFDTFARDHRLIEGLALRDVNIAEALVLRPSRGDEIIAASGNVPLLVAGTRNARPFLALSFDVRRSDLPLRTAWPLLLLRSIEVLTAREGETAIDTAMHRVERTGSASLAPRALLPRARAPTAPPSRLSTLREPWFWLIALAALIAIVEWCTHQRRWTL